MSLHTTTAHDTELATLAYASVKNVPTVEPNDRNRLGYHLWLYLRGEIPTVAEAVKQARSRYNPRTISIEDVSIYVEDQLRRLQSGELAIDAEGHFAPVKQ